MKIRMTIPLALTLFRLLVSPVVLPILIVYLLPLNLLWINACLAGLFIVLSMTDMFDGYLARRWGSESDLGKVLDPIADKFLLYSALIALLAAQKIFFAWVLILIGREFFVMGLRLIAFDQATSLPVSFLGKLKTFIQMVYVALVIINPNHHLAWNVSGWNQVESLFLSLALLMTLWSAYRYYRSFMREIESKQEAEPFMQNFEDQEPTF